eukprot:gene28214-31319_t
MARVAASHQFRDKVLTASGEVFYPFALVDGVLRFEGINSVLAFELADLLKKADGGDNTNTLFSDTLQATIHVFAQSFGVDPAVFDSLNTEGAEGFWRSNFTATIPGKFTKKPGTISPYMNKGNDLMRDMLGYPEEYKGHDSRDAMDHLKDNLPTFVIGAKVNVFVRRMLEGLVQRNRTTHTLERLTHKNYESWVSAATWWQGVQSQLLTGAAPLACVAIGSDEGVTSKMMELRKSTVKTALNGRKPYQCLDKPYSDADWCSMSKGWSKPTLCPLTSYRLLRTAAMMSVAERCYARGDHVRQFRFLGFNYWAYKSHETFLVKDRDMDALVLAIFGHKEDTGADIQFSVYTRHRDVTKCAIYWLYLYLQMEDIVHGSGLQRDFGSAEEPSTAFWDYYLFHKEGSLTTQFDPKAHGQAVRSSQALTKNVFGASTHHSRKTSVTRDRTFMDMPAESQKQMGNWACSVFTTTYSKLPDGTTGAKQGGFLTRAEYYLPRADLLPTDFNELESTGHEFVAGFQAMAEDWPFSDADFLHAQLLNRNYESTSPWRSLICSALAWDGARVQFFLLKTIEKSPVDPRPLT